MNRTRKSASSLLGAFALSLFAVTAFGQATLTLTFEGMDSHIGKPFELRVVDASTGREVDRVSIPEIDASAFDISISEIPLGTSYQIDYYADANGNDGTTHHRPIMLGESNSPISRATCRSSWSTASTSSTSPGLRDSMGRSKTRSTPPR